MMTIAGRLTPEFWGVIVVCALAGMVFPAAGALAVVVALAAACAAQGAYVLAAACGAAGIAWWIMCGRRGTFDANVGASVPLAGALYSAAALPLPSALLLRPKCALVTAVYSMIALFALACTGSCALEGWNVFAAQDAFAAEGVQACAGVMLTNPGVWIEAVLWIAAAFVGSLACERGRVVATCGIVLAGCMTCAGLCAPGYFATQGAAWMPDIVPLVVCVCATTSAAVFAALGVPARLRQD